MKYDYEPRVVLMLTCTKDKIDENDVECTNIEEDIQGRDVVTFICPECDKEHQSYRLG